MGLQGGISNFFVVVVVVSAGIYFFGAKLFSVLKGSCDVFPFGILSERILVIRTFPPVGWVGGRAGRWGG